MFKEHTDTFLISFYNLIVENIGILCITADQNLTQIRKQNQVWTDCEIANLKPAGSAPV